MSRLTACPNRLCIAALDASPRGRPGTDMLRASIAAASEGNARRGSSASWRIPGPLHAGDLQDAVSYLLGQHELRVRRGAHQHLVKFEIAAGANPDHATFTQQVDEILEQAAIEELGRIESVEHVDAL